MGFTVYIDESGETGIEKVRDGKKPGASPYFVLGAVVCQPTSEVFARNAITQFRAEIGKTVWKHATELDHSEKAYLSQKLGRLPVRYFALISNKATLHNYKETIASNPHKFYNKCVKYLLECICGYLSKHVNSSDEIKVVLERRNHDYDTMLRYLQTVKENPIYGPSKSLTYLNPFGISTKAKGEDDMLEIADFVAHAVYQCTNRSQSNFGIPEPRYFLEMSSRFAGNKLNKPLGTGVKCIQSLESLGLDPDIKKTLENLRVTPPSR